MQHDTHGKKKKEKGPLQHLKQACVQINDVFPVIIGENTYVC